MTKKPADLNKPAPKRDAEADSKTGVMTTDSGKEVEPVSPAIPHGAENVVEDDDNDVFTKDELLSMIGKFEPGDKVFLPTDAEGNLKGTLTDNIDEAGEWFVPAFITVDGEGIATSAGAPISKRMNPDTKEEQGERPERTQDEKDANAKGASGRNTKDT